MRRRTKRDLGILAGALVIIGAVVFFNSQVQRTALAAEMTQWRLRVEAERRGMGLQLLNWNIIQATKGSLSGGGRFHPDLVAYNGQTVNLIGFMVPGEQFREVTDFLLLPMPIECYFCQIPPARDVFHVRLREGETADIYKEPVLISGILTIHEGPGVKFFYTIEEATLGPGEMGGPLNKRPLKVEHMLPQHERDTEGLLDPYKDAPAPDPGS